MADFDKIYARYTFQSNIWQVFLFNPKIYFESVKTILQVTRWKHISCNIKFKEVIQI